MADRVIIVGLRRGGSLVPASEIRQMIGRAGRKHGGTASVQVVLDQLDEGRIDDLMSQGATKVRSSLHNPDILAPSLLPDICDGNVTDVESAKRWCDRCFEGGLPLSQALSLLVECESISMVNEKIRPTELGKCAARFYFHPADVFAWRENFEYLFELEYQNEALGPAWALGNVPYDRVIGDLGDHRQVSSECCSELPMGLDVMEGSLINVVSWWYLTGGPSIGDLRYSAIERKRGFGRYLRALQWLDSHFGWGREDYWAELKTRVSLGIGPELMQLCRYPGITKGRAQYLHSVGVTGEGDMKRALELIEEVDDDFRFAIESAARQDGQ
jgi:hypothetical protein